jgi:hypothetical protein
MTRWRTLALVLWVAFMAVLAVAGDVGTQHVAAQVQAPANDGSGVMVTARVHCGSVVSPAGDVPDAGWVYSGQSCAQKLAALRRAAWEWPAGIAAVFGLLALALAVVKRGSGRQPWVGATTPPVPHVQSP